MTKRKPIKLRWGCLKKLASDCDVGLATVKRALKWDSDTDLQMSIRKQANDLGYVKRRRKLPTPKVQSYETDSIRDNREGMALQ